MESSNSNFNENHLNKNNYNRDIYSNLNNYQNQNTPNKEIHFAGKNFTEERNNVNFLNNNQNFNKNKSQMYYKLETQMNKNNENENENLAKFFFFLRKKRENSEYNNDLIKGKNNPEIFLNPNEKNKKFKKIARINVTKIKSDSNIVNTKRQFDNYNENENENNFQKRNFMDKLNSCQSIFSVNCPQKNSTNSNKYGYKNEINEKNLITIPENENEIEKNYEHLNNFKQSNFFINKNAAIF